MKTCITKIDEYNPGKTTRKRKLNCIWWYADMGSNKKVQLKLTALFNWRQKLNNSLVFIAPSNSVVPKMLD